MLCVLNAGGQIDENDEDPFEDPPEDIVFGFAHVLLLALSEGVPVGPKLQTPIWDSHGGYQGGLVCSAYVWLPEQSTSCDPPLRFPCTAESDILPFGDLPEDYFQIGSKVHFLIQVCVSALMYG